MPSRPKPVRWLFEYAATRVVVGGLSLLRRMCRDRIGHFLGRLGWRLDRRHRRIALVNLERALPELSPAERESIAKRSFENLGRLAMEILFLGRDAEARMSRTKIEGWEHIQAAERAGKGYFLVSGHFGNWEWVARLQGAMGYPLWMVTRPIDNPYLEGFLARRREATGNRVVHKRNATREMLKGLKEGKGIAFIIDQNMGEPGHVFVEFFGRPAATTPAMGSLAARRDVPVIPVFAYPEEDGGYRVVYGPPVPVPQTEDRDADGLAVTAEATRRLEEAIRSSPHAWFWMHRRWRTRPEGPDEGYES